MKLKDGIPDLYFKHFAPWVRLEPRSRKRDFDDGIAARVADPLWLLTRQWQMGEFKAENAGSPLRVELTYQTHPINFLPSAKQSEADVPTEVLVEREMFTLTWKERVRFGQEFERRARITLGSRANRLITNFRGEYGLRPPPAKQWVEMDKNTRRFVQLLHGKVIDWKLLDAARNGGKLSLVSTAVTQTELDELFDQIRKWRSALYCEPAEDAAGNTWTSNELAYRFDLKSPTGDSSQTHLVADNYRSGDFDWYSVKGKPDLTGSWIDAKEPINAYATRITVGGTSLRWWEFEDAKTDFGNIDVATPDLTKLLLMEFVLGHGDDWFSVPLPVEPGNLVKVKKLKVFSVFGDDGDKDIDIPPARKLDANPLKRWEVFTIAGEGEHDAPGIGDFIYVPHIVAHREESPPLEEVRFLRDEGANMVWGVEHLLPDGLGKPVRGFEAHLERHSPAERKDAIQWLQRLREAERAVKHLSVQDRAAKEADLAWLELQRNILGQISPTLTQEARLKYRLATVVPDNWIPFVPATVSLKEEPVRIRLNRAQMLRNTDDELPTPIPALSRLLGTWLDPLLWLEEYTVPRAGVRVLLMKQRARDSKGRTFVWLGKKVVTGRGEGSSGLKFDITTY